jgi:GH25 family lysozyme M1 (1,4-beta-N-acetylmuramidase)
MARRTESEQTPLRSAQLLARLLEEEVLPRLNDRATNGDGMSERPDEDATGPVPAAAQQALEALYPELSSDSATALAALFDSVTDHGTAEGDAPHETPDEDSDHPVERRPGSGAPMAMGAAGARAFATAARGGRIVISPGVRIGPVGRLLLQILNHYPRRGQLTITDGVRNANDHHGGLMYGGSPTAALDIVAAGPARMRDIAKWLYDHFAGDIVELIHTTPFNTDRGFYVDNQKKYPGGGIFGAAIRRQHRNHVHFACSRKLATRILNRLRRRKPAAPRRGVRPAPGVAPPAVWGWDASGHDWKRGPMDLVAAKKAGISFFTHKCSEGHTFKVAEYKRGVDRARAARIPVLGAYHVLWPGNPIKEARFFFNLVNTQTPWWKDVPWIWQLDAEKFDKMPRKPSPAECKRFMTELKRLAGGRGYFIAYAPRWAYGDTFTIGFDLWASDYSGSGAPRPFKEQYKGVPQKSWRPYSGRRPRILQFASDATIGRQKTCDANRFNGSLQELIALTGRKAAPRRVRPGTSAPARQVPGEIRQSA